MKPAVQQSCIPVHACRSSRPPHNQQRGRASITKTHQSLQGQQTAGGCRPARSAAVARPAVTAHPPLESRPRPRHPAGCGSCRAAALPAAAGPASGRRQTARTATAAAGCDPPPHLRCPRSPPRCTLQQGGAIQRGAGRAVNAWQRSAADGQIAASRAWQAHRQQFWKLAGIQLQQSRHSAPSREAHGSQIRAVPPVLVPPSARAGGPEAAHPKTLLLLMAAGAHTAVPALAAPAAAATAPAPAAAAAPAALAARLPAAACWRAPPPAATEAALVAPAAAALAPAAGAPWQQVSAGP